jgi:outer membrane lipoprotein-sorting protein
MRIFFCSFLLIIPFICCAQTDKEKKVLTQMISACEKLKSASFILSTSERIRDGTVEKGEMFVKLQHKPLRLYLHLYNPSKGTEILYRKGEWNDHLYISPNGFPYINLRLDPDNANVRKNSHHSVCDIGFDYLMAMIKHYQQVFGPKLYEYLVLSDTVQFELHRCLKMEFDYPAFGYTVQTVKPGENVSTIAARNFVHEYMIISANKNVDDIHDVKAGQQLRIPNMFARKIIFYLDLRTMLPLVQEIHDEKGFFERYEYKSFVLNPEIDPAEFTPDYPGYPGYGF